MRQKIETCIRNLLAHRNEELGMVYLKKSRDKFSQLLTKIRGDESNEAAVKLLEVTFDALFEKRNKAIIAQTLARLLLERNKFVKAEEWANKGIELQPNYSGLYDTLGYVHKQNLR